MDIKNNMENIKDDMKKGMSKVGNQRIRRREEDEL